MWRLALPFIAVAVFAAADFSGIEARLAANKFRNALESLQQIPERSFRWHLLASQAYEGLNDPAQAVAEAEAALGLEPRNEAGHLRLGQIFLTHNTPDAALEVFSGAQKLFPDSFLVRLGKGLALKEIQRYDEAATELRLALAQNPYSGLAFDGLATSLLHSLRYDLLVETAESFIKRSPEDYRGYYFLAAGRDGLGLPGKETRAALEESVRRNPKFAASYALLGKVQLRENDATGAVKSLEQAVALRPDHTQSHLTLAKAYRTLGREADAAREFQTVRDLNEKGRQPPPSLRYYRGAR